MCDSGYMLENLCYNRTLWPKIANSKNSQTVGVLNAKLSVKERLATVPIDKISSVIDLVSIHKFCYKKYYTNIIDSERNDECIDFTIMCVCVFHVCHQLDII